MGSRCAAVGLVIATLQAGCGPDGAVEADASSSAAETSSSEGGTTGPDPSGSADTTSTTASTSSADASSSEDGEPTTSTIGPNAAPTPLDDVLYSKQGIALRVPAAAGVLANDVDPDGDALEVVEWDPFSEFGAGIALAVDGSLTYSATADRWGADAFLYSVGDAIATASATVTVLVAPTLASLNQIDAGHGGFAIDGENGNDRTGTGLAAAGDVNGDGLGDILVGSVAAYSSGPQAGRVYVVFGKLDTERVSLSDIVVGDGGFVIDAEGGYDAAGVVAGGGDANGDGLADIVVGARLAEPGGRAYVVFGKNDTEAVRLADLAVDDAGFAMFAEHEEDLAGETVGWAGDVDGDGLSDVVVGAPSAAPNGPSSGRVYVVRGKVDDEPVLLADVAAGYGGFAIDGDVAYHSAGEALAGIGDVDDDGLDDVAIGTIQNGSPHGWVVLGKPDGELVSLADVAAGVGGFAMVSEPGGNIQAVGRAGDVDGNGVADLVVGAETASPNGTFSGRAYVVLGPVSTEIDLAQVAAGVGGFSLDGAVDSDGVGLAVDGAADVNGDGLDDVVVGARVHSLGVNTGRAFVVYGKLDTSAVQLADLVMGIGGFALDAEQPGSRTGYAVAVGDDVDGDGLDDVLVSAPLVDTDETDVGRSYVVFGVPTEAR